VTEATRRSISVDFENAFAAQSSPSNKQFPFDSARPKPSEANNNWAWARSLLCCVYAAWFELHATCISRSPDVPQIARMSSILDLFQALTDMTGLGILPDEGSPPACLLSFSFSLLMLFGRLPQAFIGRCYSCVANSIKRIKRSLSLK
jgi:hypothetical protein